METPFPKVIDASLLSAYRDCPRKAQMQYFQHWAPRNDSIHLLAGGAFASGIEAAKRAYWADGASPEQAIGRGITAVFEHFGDVEAPEGSNKTPVAMAGALHEYFNHYGFETDSIRPWGWEKKEPAVEFSFALPLAPGLRHPETGDDLLYVGRYDMIGEFGGSLWAVDEKTASQLGQSWPKQWRHRSQFTGYCWAAQQYGIPVAGAIVRGISILKNGYGHEESIQPRPAWEIDRWHEQTVRLVARLIDDWKAGAFDYNLDHSCSNYGGCQYLDVCGSPNPEAWLRAEFSRRQWDPVTRTITVLG